MPDAVTCTPSWRRQAPVGARGATVCGNGVRSAAREPRCESWLGLLPPVRPRGPLDPSDPISSSLPWGDVYRLFLCHHTRFLVHVWPKMLPLAPGAPLRPGGDAYAGLTLKLAV